MSTSKSLLLAMSFMFATSMINAYQESQEPSIVYINDLGMYQTVFKVFEEYIQGKCLHQMVIGTS